MIAYENKGGNLMKCPECGCEELEQGTSARADGEHIRWVVCSVCNWEDEECI